MARVFPQNNNGGTGGGTGDASVTDPSTPADPTDKAVVVALSPNSPLPEGTNTIGKVEVVGTISTTSTADQGIPAPLSDAWPVQVTDGINTMPAGDDNSRAIFVKTTDGTNDIVIKSASTAAQITDTALVVGLSPNSPLPSGSNAIGTVTAVQSTAANLNATVTQGTPGTLSDAWPVEITDGTNTMPTGDDSSRAIFVKTTDGINDITIKSSSTSAQVTDTAVVVGLSPNSPLPAGSNTIGKVEVVGTISTTSTSDQGSPAPLSDAWPVQITDGVNTLPMGDDPSRAIFVKTTDGVNDLTIKSASTAAQVGDTSIVVGLSPNSPLPAGSNTIGKVEVIGSTVTVDQGMPAALADSWPVQLTDGTNIMPTGDSISRAIFVKATDGTNDITIKAASTAAQATDTSLVVGLSPNSPLPAGSNTIGTVTAVQSTAANLNATVTQGTAAALSDAWPVEITDGINTMPTGDDASRAIFVKTTDGINDVTIKAASTATQAIDTSLVVGLSPNSPLPSGSNTIGKVEVIGTINTASNADQGDAAPLSGAWPVLVTDGTNTLPVGDNSSRAIFVKTTDGTNDITIKAASTASQATDTSIVVGLSPNSPLPAGSNAIGTVTAVQATAANFNATVSQGSPASLLDAWPVEITDGTNTMPIGDVKTRAIFVKPTDGINNITVKAASETAQNTDTSIVVGISPNSPLPTGSNTIGKVEILGTVDVTGTIEQGLPASLSDAWPVQITDGTNTMPAGDDSTRAIFVKTTDGVNDLTIKASSTAAQVTDTSIVVGLSPNSPLPAGSNTIGTVSAVQSTAANLNATVTQGSAASLSDAWPVEITDGLNTMPVGDDPSRAIFVKTTDGTNDISIKAASTAAQISDTSLVVGLSPNSPLPSGSNTIGKVEVVGTISTTSTSDQGSPAVLADAWPVQITDGVNTLPVGDDSSRAIFVKTTDGTNDITIKAASTAVQATDTSLVVGLSPNSPLPAGSNAIGTVTAVQSTAANLNATVIQGTPGALSDAWPVEITDGTNTMPTGDAAARAIFVKTTDGTNDITIKASSTAAQIIDTSIVVGLSPNSPLPSGSNTIGTVTAVQSTAANLNATVAQGIPGAMSDAWFVEITDGINTMPTGDDSSRSIFVTPTDGINDITIKSSSTSAQVTDTAIVVGLSPNSPLPSGTNTIGKVEVVGTISTTSTADQGAPAILSDAWPVKVTDGINTLPTGDDASRAIFIKTTDGTNDITIKAASTAVQITDTSIAVGLSPNSPLPAGSNAIGTVTAVQSTAANLNATVVQTTAANLNATVTQGTAAALSDAWPVEITDGTNTMPVGDISSRAIFVKTTDGTNDVTIKAASTAAQAADTSIVVGLSPNSALPSGSNTIGKVEIVGTVSTTTTSDQGLPAPLSDAWPVQITDGTNTLPTGDDASRAIFVKTTDGTNDLTIKAASTATQTTDTSIVVGLSPNSPLPSGSNTIGTVTAVQSTASNLNATVTQGSPGTLSDAWPVEITDGVNTMPTGDNSSRAIFVKTTDGTNDISIKGSSTAAQTTDTSLVVGLSPNSPLPSGSNTIGKVEVVGTISTTSTADQGLPAPLSDAWPVQVTDGVNTMPVGDDASRAIFVKTTDGINDVTIKAASTAAQVTDTSLVVGLSPNSPLPAGSNTIGSVTAVQSTAANLNATVTQGTAAALSDAWPVEITDGTNTMPTGDSVSRAIFVKTTDGTNNLTIKASSDAAQIGDTSIVVGLSPNSPLPTGSNTIGTVTAVQSTAANLNATVVQSTASNLNATAAQGNPAALSDAWPVQITDGTNTMPTGDDAARAIFVKTTDGTNDLTIKPASTATQATDTSIVVGLSPNSPLPAGSNAIGTVTAVQSTAANLNATVTQGSPGLLSDAWPVEITDGTNSMPTGDAAVRAIFVKTTDGTNNVTIKGSSTAAQANDTSLVVGLSPNSSLPAGTNTIGKVEIVGTISTTTTADQGLPAPLSDAWPVQITDGVNTLPAGDDSSRAIFVKTTDGTNDLTIKAASSAAQVTDTSIVVGLSPNSPLPAGSNTIGTVTAVQTTAANLNATVTQGTAAALSDAWPVEITDGTNTMPTGDNAVRAIFVKTTDGTNDLTIKSASTAAQVTDTSIVVGLSPNSPLPAGSNAIGTVTAVQSTATNLNATVVQATAANLNATAAQGAPGALSNAWPVEITDGTNTMPTGDVSSRAVFVKTTDGTNDISIKGASTATQASDTSLVVGLSPNSPLPSGSNTIGKVEIVGTISTTTTADQGLPAALSDAWPVQITDGTNTLPTGDDASRAIFVKTTDGINDISIKGASTAAQATDTSLVVGLSPNSPLPAGSNAIGTVTAVQSTAANLNATVVQNIAANLNATVTQGTPGVLADAWPVEVTDGTNTLPTGDAPARAIFIKATDGTNNITIKGSSTAAQVSDTAIVVGLSPNSPLPSGSNTIGKVELVTSSVTSDQGTPAALADAWPVQITDGTNTMPAGDDSSRAVFVKTTDGTNDITIKGSSTAAQVTDTSIVVGLSPNSPLPAGSNAIGTVTTVQSTAANLNATVVQAVAANLNTTSAQGLPAALSNAWPVEVTDGTNTLPTGDAAARAIFVKTTDGTNDLTIKAASTAAQATDTSVVIGLSPNSPLPAGSNAIGTVTAVQATAANFNATVSQGTPGLLSDAWPVEITDGTNTMPTGDAAARAIFVKTTDGTNDVTIKGASTAAQASDTSLVVGLSPNSPLPAGSNTIGTVTATQSTAANFNATVVQAVAANLNTTSAQGSPASLANAWPVEVTDGTNTLPTGDAAARAIFVKTTDGTNDITIKGASTATQATDTSLVVGISPNSPLPSGTNTIGKVEIVGTIGSALIADQGSPAVLADAWPVQVTDGTNTLPTGDAAARAIFVKTTDGTNNITIKSASTAAQATDTSIVVGLSPNSPLPAGSNSIGTVTAVQSTAANLNATVVQSNAANFNATVVQSTAANLNATVAQGTAAALSGAWSTKITDGTNGPAAVKAANTSALASDPSLVVQISPKQQPIPTTVVPGYAEAGSVIGRVTGLAANSFSVVRATTYVEQTTQAQRSIVSTSANDTAAGTGARTVRIVYLNASGAGPFTETITLNGLTAVNTVATDICFIERIDVLSVGSNGSNVGTLNLYTGTGATGTIFAAVGLGNIAAGVGDNQTLYAHHYVPSGYKVSGYYVSVGIIASAGGGSSTTVIRYRDPTSSTSPWKLASDIINAAQGNSTARVYYASISIPGPIVVAAFATPANNNSTATCSFDYSDSPV